MAHGILKNYQQTPLYRQAHPGRALPKVPGIRPVTCQTNLSPLPGQHPARQFSTSLQGRASAHYTPSMNFIGTNRLEHISQTATYYCQPLLLSPQAVYPYPGVQTFVQENRVETTSGALVEYEYHPGAFALPTAYTTPTLQPENTKASHQPLSNSYCSKLSSLTRCFEQKTDKLASEIDTLNEKKKATLSKGENNQVREQPVSTSMTKGNTQLKSEDPKPPALQEAVAIFEDKATKFCDTLDYSKTFEALKAEAEEAMEGELNFPSRKLWLFTELAFHSFHKNRKFIINTSRAMKKSYKLHFKVSSEDPGNQEDFKSRKQSKKWLTEHFGTNKKLSDNKLALLSKNTVPATVEKARRLLGNCLSFFQLAIAPGLELLKEIKKNDFKLPEGLPLDQLITHFEICQDALKTLVSEYKEPLEHPVITPELISLKTSLFKKLNLYGENSFQNENSRHTPNQAYKAGYRQVMMEHSREIDNLHNHPHIDTEELLNSYTEIHTGLQSLRQPSTDCL